MKNRRQYRGFSLTEVLLAVGTLAVGMIFISGTFLTGIHFSTISTERTMAAVVADEAFAKIQLYGIDFNPALWDVDKTYPVDPNKSVVFNAVSTIDLIEFAYPSTVTLTDKQYYWSALCRLVNKRNEPDDPNRLVQVTVFVSRKVGSSTTYPGGAGRPVPVRIEVSQVSSNELQIMGDKTLINDGYKIIDDKNGLLYRVLERYPDNDSVILLDRPWVPRIVPPPEEVWVIPPPDGGGRYPCIGIYQRVIRFNDRI